MKKILAFLCCVPVFAQTPDFVMTDGIPAEIHRANIGKIVFLDANVPIEKLSEQNFLKTFTPKRNSQLEMRVFLANSIIHYQHRLAPELSVEELRVSGNYQFTFLIDGKEIYHENIHYGCGLRKDKTTTFRVPLIDAKGGDWWSVYLYDRFLDNGGRMALTDGKHRFEIQLRPYLKINEKLLVGDVIASGGLDFQIRNYVPKASETEIQPIAAQKDFPVTDATFDRDKIRELNRQILTEVFRQITGVTVITDGKLALEEYFNGAARDSLHDTRSVGKSFTSILMDLAISDGFIKDENQRLSSFYAPQRPRLRNVLLRGQWRQPCLYFQGHSIDRRDHGQGVQPSLCALAGGQDDVRIYSAGVSGKIGYWERFA